MERKKIKFQDDTQIIYACGCSESKLEPPEFWEKLCEKHCEHLDYERSGEILYCINCQKILNEGYRFLQKTLNNNWKLIQDYKDMERRNGAKVVPLLDEDASLIYIKV